MRVIPGSWSQLLFFSSFLALIWYTCLCHVCIYAENEQHLIKGHQGLSAVSETKYQVAKNGTKFIKQVRHHLIDNFLHDNQAKTAGIFFIYACSN